MPYKKSVSFYCRRPMDNSLLKKSPGLANGNEASCYDQQCPLKNKCPKKLTISGPAIKDSRLRNLKRRQLEGALIGIPINNNET